MENNMQASPIGDVNAIFNFKLIYIIIILKH